MFRKRKTSELADPKGVSTPQRRELMKKLEPAMIFSIIILMLGHKKQEGKCLR